MTSEQSKNLKIGDRIYWRGDPKDGGRITDKSWDVVAIAWDNGQTARMHFNDMSEVQLEPNKHTTRDERKD